jgi:signal transduction histidine kinase/DNA-binding response OmpR family regulator
MKKNIFLSLLISLAFFSTARTQDSLTAYNITADTATRIILPADQWQTMADTTGNLTLHQVINSYLFQNNDVRINYRIHVYWQRFQVINDLPKEAKISLPEVSSRADLYAKINGGEWQHFITGTVVKWSQRDGLKRIPAFTLSIPAGDTLSVYKRTFWNYIAFQPDSMKVSFGFTDKMIQDNYIEDNFHGLTEIQDAFLLGMFILSLVINFYFYLIVREKEFLYFCLFIFASGIQAICSLDDIFFKEQPQLVLYLYILSNCTSGFFLIQFVRHFLKSFQHFPKWDKYLVFLNYTIVVVLVATSFSSAVFHANLSKVSHVSENVIKLLYGITLLLTLSLYVRNTNRITKLILIALTPVLCLHVAAYSIAVINGLYYPKLGAPDVTAYHTEFTRAAFFILIICYLWMMIIFTWVLFQRFSNVRKKLAQQTSLDQMKTRFFTNISHEFRTPLTLIIGPIEDLLQDKNARKFREPLQYIHRNSKRLLQLINQLLDLSKLNVGNYAINTTREDIVPFVKQIVHSFSSMAQRKNIMLETEVDPRLKNDLRNEVTRFYFDEDIIEKILSNLLSNAFKFTPDGGNVIVSLCYSDKNMFELKVEDTGTGIPSEKIPFIFDRFYQADNSRKRQYQGTGIGLALVKELVELHKGTISVKSSVNSGTTFSCFFPFNKKIISKNAVIKNSRVENRMVIVEETEKTEEDEMVNDSRPTVLIVEDQQDVRKYIRSKLTDTYTVLEAKNGREGFEMARQHIPDLVISDVMMPEMDGFELCEQLKTNDFTSHIPVILLTARAEDMDKLTGLETGADAYLVKPFNSKELLLRVHNLIELRNKLRKKFSGKLIVKPSEITVTSKDSEFMQRLLDTVEKHISDEKFSVEQLGHEFGMSSSQINRKLKAIINQSAVEFIRSIRMQRAMELLKNNQGTIAEIAYETGFKEPAYFSRVFKNHFGIAPSEVKKEGV